MRTTTRQQLAGNGPETLILEAKNKLEENIKPSDSARLLGIHFNSNMCWTKHLILGKEALLPRLKKSMGALKFTSNYASIETKKKLVNGIIMSKLVYGITIWGLSATATVMNQCQSVQNISMRWICGLNQYTSIETLLNKCNFLSIYQSAIYFSLLQFWKMKQYGVSIRLMEWVKKTGRVQ